MKYASALAGSLMVAFVPLAANAATLNDFSASRTSPRQIRQSLQQQNTNFSQRHFSTITTPADDAADTKALQDAAKQYKVPVTCVSYKLLDGNGTPIGANLILCSPNKK